MSKKTFDFRGSPRLPGRNGSPGEFGVLIYNASGQVLPDTNGQPQFVSLLWFLLDRTSDDQFVAGIRGTIERVEFQLDARKAIKEQMAIGDGLVVLEDAQAAHLIEAILNPAKEYSALYAPNILPWLLIAKKPLPGDQRPAHQPAAVMDAAPGN